MSDKCIDALWYKEHWKDPEQWAAEDDADARTGQPFGVAEAFPPQPASTGIDPPLPPLDSDRGPPMMPSRSPRSQGVQDNGSCTCCRDGPARHGDVKAGGASREGSDSHGECHVNFSTGPRGQSTNSDLTRANADVMTLIQRMHEVILLPKMAEVGGVTRWLSVLKESMAKASMQQGCAEFPGAGIQPPPYHQPSRSVYRWHHPSKRGHRAG